MPLVSGYYGLKPMPIAQLTPPYVLPMLTDKIQMENWRQLTGALCHRRGHGGFQLRRFRPASYQFPLGFSPVQPLGTL